MTFENSALASSKRKDEHLELYATSRPSHNDFDLVQLHYHSLPHYNLSEIDLNTSLCGYTLSCPFYINAITGGSERAKKINEKLARLAKACDLFLASGSYAIALKDERYKEDFAIMRRLHNGLFACNLGIDKSPELALRALEETKADLLQIHLNPLQELLMTEGDCNFFEWKSHLQALIMQSPKPLLVKEVGCGMSLTCMEELIALGITDIDLSGKGGTNFAQIEHLRKKEAPLPYNSTEELANLGYSTVESLLFAQQLKGKVNIYASGGVRNAADIVKALALGAKAVGISGTILDMVEKYSLEECIAILEQWKLEIKQFFCMMNVKNIEELHQKKAYNLRFPLKEG